MRRLLVLPLILAACAAKPPPVVEPAMATCDAAKAQFAIGQTADAVLIAKVRTAASARAVRQVRPGQMVTMDYRGDRLNLTLDDAGKVTKVTCG